jgi:hypothetical protein
MTRKLAILALAAGGLALSACTPQKVSDFAGRKPDLDLTQYFAGHTDAWGIFVDRFGKMRRTFKVDITGTPTADGIILDERFVYDDGEKQQRVWTLKKTGPDQYQGTAPDVIGTAKGQTAGNALNWTYQVDLAVGEGTTWRVSFDDWMWQQDDKTLLNRATISRYGIEIGTVTIFFQRGQ